MDRDIYLVLWLCCRCSDRNLDGCINCVPNCLSYPSIWWEIAFGRKSPLQRTPNLLRINGVIFWCEFMFVVWTVGGYSNDMVDEPFFRHIDTILFCGAASRSTTSIGNPPYVPIELDPPHIVSIDN